MEVRQREQRAHTDGAHHVWKLHGMRNTVPARIRYISQLRRMGQHRTMAGIGRRTMTSAPGLIRAERRSLRCKRTGLKRGGPSVHPEPREPQRHHANKQPGGAASEAFGRAQVCASARHLQLRKKHVDVFAIRHRPTIRLRCLTIQQHRLSPTSLAVPTARRSQSQREPCSRSTRTIRRP